MALQRRCRLGRRWHGCVGRGNRMGCRGPGRGLGRTDRLGRRPRSRHLGARARERTRERYGSNPTGRRPGTSEGYTAAYPRSREEALAAYQDYGTLERDTGWTREVPRSPRRQTARGNGPWPELVMITAVAVIIAAVILAVTGADRSPPDGPQAAPTTLPAVTVQRTHSSVAGHREVLQEHFPACHFKGHRAHLDAHYVEGGKAESRQPGS